MYKKSVKAKRKGNVFVLVVVLSMVLIMIGATITTAVMSTTTTNAYKKVDQDLYYAAESGLQKAKSIVQDRHGPTAVGTPQVVPMGEYTSYGYTVTTTITKKSDSPIEFLVESEAVKDTQKRKLTAILKPKKVKVPVAGENLLKYNFAAPSVTVYTTNYAQTESRIISKNGKIYLEDGRDGESYIVDQDVDEIKFDDSKIKKYVGEIVITDVKDFIKTYSNKSNSGIYKEYVQYDKIEPPKNLPPGTQPGKTIEVFYVNCDYLYFAQSDKVLMLDNTIFITPAEVYIAGEHKDRDLFKDSPNNFFGASKKVTSCSTLQYNNSTIIGNKVYVAATVLNLTYPPYIGDNASITNDIYKDKVDNIITGIVPGWDNGDVGPSKDDWDYGDITEEVNY